MFWIDDLADEAKRPRPRLEGTRSADLAVVGGGYTGLWTAVLAKRANPDLHVVLIEAKRIGWAASGRNGGFCEASLTHGRENGLSRWPDEIDELDRLGLANLDAIEASEAELGIDFEFERNGALDVAIEPHQVEWLHEAAADAASRGDDTVKLLDEHQVRAEVDSPPTSARSGTRARAPSCTRPSSRPNSRASPRRPASRSSRTRPSRAWTPPDRPARCRSSPIAAASTRPARCSRPTCSRPCSSATGS
ncbi:hypothetical protein GCM10025870_12990 [Agromyces marinus]|uniref:FAD dependent oxidoreductase domain-containing protein n=1 Tax=Agromyces marinus TaxID=1389020 RepID=A0ABN6YDV2_9MICO|nr:hypothetical protein GCM10025870_12990 [Agromyces marinus]